MTKKKTESRSASKRTQQYETMLKEALARPGVREVMNVYCGWQEKNYELDVYHSATTAPEQAITTNYANTR